MKLCLGRGSSGRHLESPSPSDNLTSASVNLNIWDPRWSKPLKNVVWNIYLNILNKPKVGIWAWMIRHWAEFWGEFLCDHQSYQQGDRSSAKNLFRWWRRKGPSGQAECLKMGNTHKMTISWGKMIINHHTNSNEDLTSFYLGLEWEESVSQLLKGASGPSDGNMLKMASSTMHGCLGRKPFNHPWELSTWSPIHNSNPSPHCTKTCSRPLCFRYASNSSILA